MSYSRSLFRATKEEEEEDVLYSLFGLGKRKRMSHVQDFYF
jgi:hypothetical protein